jgi:sulfatase modifying factor 1
VTPRRWGSESACPFCAEALVRDGYELPGLVARPWLVLVVTFSPGCWGSPQSTDPIDAGTPPSCRAEGPGRTDCGASLESCCTSLLVKGGSYDRTYATDGSVPTGQTDPATVSDFRLDKYDVTVGRFRQFVTAWSGGSGFVPAPGSGKHTQLNGGLGLANSAAPGGYETGWDAADDIHVQPTPGNLGSCGYDEWTDAPGSQEALPMNCVDWYEAYAFCIFDDGFLPSEAEWEYAAAGGSQQRQYPWGSTAPGAGNEYAVYNCQYPSDAQSCSDTSNIAPVGTATLGQGLWGQLDLAGNMSQWILDWWASAYGNPCTDCANLTLSSERVLRGGYFGSNAASYMRSTYRDFDVPTDRYFASGFRCARRP